MAGSAGLYSPPGDSLLPGGGPLRPVDTHFRTAAWRVYTVRRTWSGTRRGEGTPTDDAVELVPSPLVLDRRMRKLDPVGMDEVGEVQLQEVSLTYTETELLGAVGGALAANVEWMY